MRRYILTSLALGMLFAIGSAAPASAGLRLANGLQLLNGLNFQNGFILSNGLALANSTEMGGLSLDGVILPNEAE